MLETSALASMRALEVWRLLLCQWFRTAEPHAIRKAQAMQSVVAKRLAIRPADLALMRAARSPLFRTGAIAVSNYPGEADHVPYHGI